MSKDELFETVGSAPLSEGDLGSILAEFEDPPDRVEPYLAAWVRWKASARLTEITVSDPARELEHTALLETGFEALLRMEELRPGYGAAPGVLSELVRELIYPLRRNRSPQRLEEVLRDTIEYLEPGYITRPYFQHGLIEVVQSQGRLDEASRLLDDAQREVDELGGTEEVRVALRGLRGLLFLRMGLPDRAAPLVQEALEFERDRLEDPAQRANPGFLLAAYLMRCDLLMAADRYEQVVAEAGPLVEREDVFERHAALRAGLLVRLAIAHMEVDEERDSEALAEDYLRAALREPDLEPRDRLRATTRLAFLLVLARRTDEASELARESRAIVGEWTPQSDVSPVQAAFLAAIEVRLAARDDPGGSVASFARLRTACEALLAEWRGVDPRSGGLGLARYLRERFAFAELIEATDRAEGAIAALEVLFRIQAVGSLTRLLEGPDMTAADVRRELLPLRGGLLAYFPGRDRLLAFALDRTRFAYTVIPIERAVFDEPRTEHFLPPAIGMLVATWDHALVVGHDAFGNVALEDVPLAAGDLLGDRVALSYLPSVSAGSVLASRAAADGPARTPAMTVTLVTNALHGESVRERYPDIRELAMSPAEIAALLGDHDSETRVLTGPDATLARADEAGAQSRVLHFFTHGVRDPEREVSAGLVLSPGGGSSDGIAWSEDLRGVDAPRLVVVTACGSGSGPERVGDAESSHLGGAFLQAGAAAVVVADANLDQVVAHRTMASFNRELARGVSIAEALRRARSELTDADGRNLVHVVGLGHLPAFDPPASERSRAWWVLGAALLVVAVYASARRRA